MFLADVSDKTSILEKFSFNLSKFQGAQKTLREALRRQI